MATGSPNAYRQLIVELCSQRGEAEWLEFKENNSRPDLVGKYISAMANSTALSGREKGYVIWGVRDGDHEFVGTGFDPRRVKVGNEELVAWLSRLLEPDIGFRFERVDVGERTVWVMEIPRAERRPQRFSGTEYVRVGSNNRS